MMAILAVVQSVCEEFEKCQLHESRSIHTERENIPHHTTMKGSICHTEVSSYYKKTSFNKYVD